jgi:hypothetical protein
MCVYVRVRERILRYAIVLKRGEMLRYLRNYYNMVLNISCRSSSS